MEPKKAKKPTIAQREKELLREKEQQLERMKKGLDIKEDVLRIQLEIERKKLLSPKTIETLEKIKVLRETIGFCRGQGNFIGLISESSIPPTAILSEDELIEYKFKLLELIKTL